MLNPLKTFLLLILVLTLAGAGVYVAYNRGLIKAEYLAKIPVDQIKQAINQETLQGLSTSAQTQSQTLIENSGVVLGETKNFLDTQITTNKQDEKISDKAFEYAKYVYCQQVVKEFEKKNSN